MTGPQSEMLEAFLERESVALSTEDVAVVASRIIKEMQKL
jgi:hypothetical protein